MWATPTDVVLVAVARRRQATLPSVRVRSLNLPREPTGVSFQNRPQVWAIVSDPNKLRARVCGDSGSEMSVKRKCLKTMYEKAYPRRHQGKILSSLPFSSFLTTHFPLIILLRRID